MRLAVYESTAFRRDKRRMRRSGYDMAKLEAVVDRLTQRIKLEPRLHDHAMTGNWHGHHDCHIAPDWVLIYRVVGDELQLARTGTHSDLF